MTLGRFTRPDQTVAEHILFADDDEARCFKPFFQGQNGQLRQVGTSRFVKIINLAHRADAMIGENNFIARERSVTEKAEDDPLFLPQLLDNMGFQSIIDIPLMLGTLRCEIAAGMAASLQYRIIPCSACKGGKLPDRARGQRRLPFLIRQIEIVRRQGVIVTAARRLGFFPGLEMICDGINACFPRLFQHMIEKQRCIGQEIKQRRHVFMKQRQPMFHPSVATFLADRLIERIIRRDRPEKLAIAGAEKRHRGIAEQELRRGGKFKTFKRAAGPLAQRIESADAIDGIAEEIKPHRGFCPRRKNIDQPAAHCELSGFHYGTNTGEAVRHKIGCQL